MAEAIKETNIIPIGLGELERVTKNEDALTGVGGIVAGVFGLYNDKKESFSTQFGEGLGIWGFKAAFDAYQLDRKDWKTTFLAGSLFSSSLKAFSELLEKKADFYPGFLTLKDTVQPFKLGSLFGTVAKSFGFGMKLIDLLHFDAKEVEKEFQARSLLGHDLSFMKAHFANVHWGTKITGVALATLDVLTPVLKRINTAFTEDPKKSSLKSVVKALDNKHLQTALTLFGIANGIAQLALFVLTKDEKVEESKTHIDTFDHFVSEPKNFLDVMKVPVFLMDVMNVFVKNELLKKGIKGAKDGLNAMHTRASLLLLPLKVKKLVDLESKKSLEAVLETVKFILSCESQSNWIFGKNFGHLLDSPIFFGINAVLIAGTIVKPISEIYKNGVSEFKNLETVTVVAGAAAGIGVEILKFITKKDVLTDNVILTSGLKFVLLLSSGLKLVPLLHKGYCALKEEESKKEGMTVEATAG